MNLNVKMENCFGIKKFTIKFDLNGDINVMYAKNGVMKSSFANSIEYYKNDVEIKDKFDPKIIGKISIDIDDLELLPENILVYTESNKQSYMNLSDLENIVADDESKKKLNDAIMKREIHIDAFYNKIRNDKQFNGLEKGDITKIFEEIIILPNDIKRNYIDSLIADRTFRDKFIRVEIPKNISKIYDERFLNIVKKEEVKKSLDIYVNRVEEFISEKFTAEFTPWDLYEFNSSINESSFFECAGNYIVVNDIKFCDFESLNQYVEKMKNEYELASKMTLDEKNLIEKNFKTGYSKAGLSELESNHELVKLVTNHSKYELIIGFLSKIYIDDISNICGYYESIQKERRKIIEKFNQDSSKWDETLIKFKNSFITPYEICIKNREEALLSESPPEFILNYGKYTEPIENIKHFSNGEIKSFMMLNLMFEIEKLISNGNKDIKIVVLDDLVDSYDLTNKYAFIEMIHSYSRKHNVKFVVLTHNFSFFRSIAQKIERKHLYHFSRLEDKIEPETVHKKSYFKVIIKDINNKSVKDIFAKNDLLIQFIASVPFAREILDIKQSDSSQNSNKIFLDESMHIKKGNKSDFIERYSNLLNEELGVVINVDDDKCSKKFSEIIYECIKTLENKTDLETKILFALGSRLKIEELGIKLINKHGEFKEPSANQTGFILNELENIEDDLCKRFHTLANKINLYCGDHIHYNAFMYEYLLDHDIQYMVKNYHELLAFEKETD